MHVSMRVRRLVHRHSNEYTRRTQTVTTVNKTRLTPTSAILLVSRILVVPMSCSGIVSFVRR
jgi:hypothetical protein